MSELPPDRSHVLTEVEHLSGRDLGSASIEESIEWIAEDHEQVVESLRRAGPQLAPLIEAVVKALRTGGRLIYVGAGTSGRLGVLDASECPPTFNIDPASVIGLIAGGDTALRTSSEGLEDDFHGAHDALHRLSPGADDVLVGIAAGGTTPYVLGAIEEADRLGAVGAMITCAPRKAPTGCRHLIVLETGPELLTGSTQAQGRFGDQTGAQHDHHRGLFAQLGKVRGGLMIDMRATNDEAFRPCDPDSSSLSSPDSLVRTPPAVCRKANLDLRATIEMLERS